MLGNILFFDRGQLFSDRGFFFDRGQLFSDRACLSLDCGCFCFECGCVFFAGPGKEALSCPGQNSPERTDLQKCYGSSCSESIRSPEHPCPDHINVRLPRACGHQSIYARIIIPFVFQEHTVTRASTPRP